MTIFNLGSINVDHVYAVDHFVAPGETLASTRYAMHAGGKGFNQSIALARAGATVRHIGRIGKDAAWLVERLAREGVEVSMVKVVDAPTGHAIIQVSPAGENAIVVHGGANQEIAPADVVGALAVSAPGDYLLLQNETSAVADAIREAAPRGIKIVFNPAPMSPSALDLPLELVDLFIMNEREAAGLTGKQTPEAVRIAMRRRFPRSATVLTMGRQGAVYVDAESVHRQRAPAVAAVDTTAAGDTFIGFFLATYAQGGDAARALAVGCRAAALCVTRPGAADSIPLRKDLDLDAADASAARTKPRR